MRVYIFTEGVGDKGSGHVTRCLSITQAFQERGVSVSFYLNAGESVVGVLEGTDHKVVDWLERRDEVLKEVNGADIAIVDSYQAGISFYSAVSAAVKVPVYIDDTMRLKYPRGVVVNGAIGAEDMDYGSSSVITSLLGTKYIPLRKAFWGVPEKIIRNSVENILVTFGGEDPRAMTRKVLELIRADFPGIRITVVVGMGFKDQFSLDQRKNSETVYVFNPNDSEMKELMIAADIAISAGGQTLYELARVGVPTVTIAVADNQRQNIQGWDRAGFIRHAGFWNDTNTMKNMGGIIETLFDPVTRSSASVSGKGLVDGRGALRLVDKILDEVSR